MMEARFVRWILAGVMWISASSVFAAGDHQVGVSIGDYYVVKKGVHCGEYLEPGSRCAVSAFNEESGSYEMVVVQKVNNELKAKVLFLKGDEFEGCINQGHVQLVRKANSSEVAFLTDNIDAWKIVRDRMIADIELPEIKRKQDEARRAAEQKHKAGEARTAAYKEKVKRGGVVEFHLTEWGFSKITISNTSSQECKDMTGIVTYVAKSGTTLASKRFTIYDTIPPQSVKTFTNIRIGLAPDQSEKASVTLTNCR